MFKKLRIAILLCVLANVACSAWLTRWRRAYVASGPARVVMAEEGSLADLTAQLIALAAVVWTEGPVFDAVAQALRAT